DQRDTVMAALAEGEPEEQAFFGLLKGRVIDAYYKSEIGLLGELAWVGHEFHSEFPGRCTHADPWNHPRPTWQRGHNAHGTRADAAVPVVDQTSGSTLSDGRRR